MDGGIKIILKKIEIKNFMGVHEVTLDDLGIFNVIIGKNKTGKSSILKLLANYKINDKFWVSNKKVTSEKEEGNPIELLKLIWKLNSEEISEINEVLSDLKTSQISSNNHIMATEHRPINNHSVKFFSNQNLSRPSHEVHKVSQNMFKETIFGGKKINMLPCIRYMSVDLEPRITEHNLIGKNEDPEQILYKNQEILIFDQILNWLDLKNRKGREIIEFMKHINKLIDINLEINEFEADDFFLLTLDYEELGYRFEKQFRYVGHATQQLILILFYCFFQKDHLILIDEIETGFHPSLQKKLYNTICELAEKNNNQIIATTHSSVFIDLCKNIYLLELTEHGSISYDNKDFKLIKAKDQLIEPNHLEAATILFTYKDSTLLKLGFDDLKLKMVNNLNEYFDSINVYFDFNKADDEFKKILQLGTPFEDSKTRLLQNSYFLSKKVTTIYLNNSNKSDKRPKFIFICQINKLPIEEREKIHKKFEKYSKEYQEERFNVLCSYCWDPSKFKNEKILKYTKEQAMEKKREIKNRLEQIQKDNIFKNNKGKILIIFPENTIPYCALDYLIEFATNNQVVIIGGMEHNTILGIKEELNKLFTNNKDKNYDKRYIPVNYLDLYKKYTESPGFEELYVDIGKFIETELPFYQKFVEDHEIISQSVITKMNKAKNIIFIRKAFLNQAVIINSDKKFSFQVKNIPVIIFNKQNKNYINEGIPSILKPHIKKFETDVGPLSVLICKDFLVNHEIIPDWMEKNGILTVVIPSFTTLINPFRDKFGEIIRLDKNKNKIFSFASLAEYGGSGVYFYNNRREYEPGGNLKFDPGEELCKSFKIEI